MPEHYERYGFRTNPFVVRELDLLASSGRDRLRLIDGFKQLRRVARFLRDSILANQPAFIVIKGGEKSGMTSAASAILRLYRMLRLLPPGRFAAVALRSPNHNPLDVYNAWTSAFYNKLALQLTLNLDEAARTRLLQARNSANATTLRWDLQLAIQGVHPAFQAPPISGFGTCIERIKTAEIIEIARVAFDAIPTVCVFTVRPNEFDQKFDDFRDQNSDIHYLELGSLAAQDVERIIRARWQNGTDIPLDLNALGACFAAQDRSVGALLETVNKMLRIKAKANPFRGAADTWPTDRRLEFAGTSTRELFEAVINGGN